jgi:hypothetical protein
METKELNFYQEFVENKGSISVYDDDEQHALVASLPTVEEDSYNSD